MLLLCYALHKNGILKSFTRRSLLSDKPPFGKLKVRRYLYVVGTKSFAPLDVLLNLPVRCYSYFLAERVNLLTIQDAYEEAVHLLQRLFDLTLSVSAAETISQQSADHYDVYYA